MNLSTSVPILLLLVGPVSTLHAEDEYFDSNGVKIRYVVAGEGEAVVLVHGWRGDSSMWGRDRTTGATKLNTTGAEGFQFLALDCRGHGKSDKPHDAKKYGVEQAEDIVRLLDHRKIKKAHLVGYSSGAFILGHIAANHPERVQSVVFAGQAPLLRTETPASFSEVELFAKLVDEGKGLGQYLREITPAGRAKPNPEQAEVFAKIMFKDQDLVAFAAAGRTYPELFVTAERLKKCQAPMLFLHGANESDYVKGQVKAVRKILGRGELVTIEGGDHITTLTKPEFGKELLKFLKANQGKDGR